MVWLILLAVAGTVWLVRRAAKDARERREMLARIDQVHKEYLETMERIFNR